MKISEIFRSIEGEGPRQGHLCTFIRTHSCPLRCSYCDSLYAVEGNDFKEMTIVDIMNEVNRLGGYFCTVTGGEPLIQQDFSLLINELTNQGYLVNIETSGAVDYTPYLSRDDVFVTADWKCKSSGMSDKMIKDQIRYLRNKDVLKFVVGSEEDLFEMMDLIPETSAQIFVSPVFGKIEPKEIVDFMQAHELFDVRVQVQLHKIIWDPMARGV